MMYHRPQIQGNKCCRKSIIVSIVIGRSACQKLSRISVDSPITIPLRHSSISIRKRSCIMYGVTTSNMSLIWTLIVQKTRTVLTRILTMRWHHQRYLTRKFYTLGMGIDDCRLSTITFIVENTFRKYACTIIFRFFIKNAAIRVSDSTMLTLKQIPTLKFFASLLLKFPTCLVEFYSSDQTLKRNK